MSGKLVNNPLVGGGGRENFNGVQPKSIAALFGIHFEVCIEMHSDNPDKKYVLS